MAHSCHGNCHSLQVCPFYLLQEFQERDCTCLLLGNGLLLLKVIAGHMDDRVPSVVVKPSAFACVCVPDWILEGALLLIIDNHAMA